MGAGFVSCAGLIAEHLCVVMKPPAKPTRGPESRQMGTT